MRLKDLIKQSGYYRFKITPSQAEAELRDVMSDGTIKIALTQPPEKGKANKELIGFIAEQLDLDRSDIKIVSGLSSRMKAVSVDMNSN